MSISQTQNGGYSALNISSEKTKEKFQETYKQIQTKQEEEATEKQALVFGIQYINLHNFPIGPEALKVININDCKKYKIVCFFKEYKAVKIGFVEYNDNSLDFIDTIKTDEGDVKKELFLISEGSFQDALKLYEKLPQNRIFSTGVTIETDFFEKILKEIEKFEDVKQKIAETDITQITTVLIASAIKFNSSDIHIEAEETKVSVRFRIDGMLQEITKMEKKLWPKIISRVKLLAGLKMNVENIPQDGRFTIFLEKDRVDVRVSTLPTTFGESAVMRLLRSSSVDLPFEELGFSKSNLEEMQDQLTKSMGMIITTGPTGAGKTTTLYAMLKELNKPQVNIITLEDPVEYKLKGINQSQIDYSKNYDFATGLRAILRQDPNVVMVGEIRDLETAEIAINASLTGHVVLSTIHANSASAAIPRFLAMGVKPFLLAPSLNVILSQRLVRKICPHCIEEYKPDEQNLKRAKVYLSEITDKAKEKINVDLDLNNLKFYRGKGCEKCNYIGYSGRIGIYEVLPITNKLEEAIMKGEVSEYEIKELCKNEGIVNMIQDGLIKAIEGKTTIEEVFRVARN
ncbi:type II/IV secretion system protein [bacterium]|nr:type II/IV secretion system protein [bacterium]